MCWIFVYLQSWRDDRHIVCGTFVLLLLNLNAILLVKSCKISEFPCKGGTVCLPLDKFCDGKNDCGDFSDEPKFCTGEWIKFWYLCFSILCIKNLKWWGSFVEICAKTSICKWKNQFEIDIEAKRQILLIYNEWHVESTLAILFTT